MAHSSATIDASNFVLHSGHLGEVNPRRLYPQLLQWSGG